MTHTEQWIGIGIAIFVLLVLFGVGGLIALAHWSFTTPQKPRDARGEIETDDYDT